MWLRSLQALTWRLFHLHILLSTAACSLPYEKRPTKAVNIVLLIDASTSTKASRHVPEIVTSFNNKLVKQGIGNESRSNLFCTIVFGGLYSTKAKLLRASGNRACIPAAEYWSFFSNSVEDKLLQEGGVEDGWEAMELLVNLTQSKQIPVDNDLVRTSALLFTDEDRDVSQHGTALKRYPVIRMMRRARVSLDVIVDAVFTHTTTGKRVVGIESSSSEVSYDIKWCRKVTGPLRYVGWRQTGKHYISMAVDRLYGSAWDINLMLHNDPLSRICLLQRAADAFVERVTETCFKCKCDCNFNRFCTPTVNPLKCNWWQTLPARWSGVFMFESWHSRHARVLPFRPPNSPKVV